MLQVLACGPIFAAQEQLLYAMDGAVEVPELAGLGFIVPL